MKREAGKGDAPRKGANQEAYASGWDRIFLKEPVLHTCPYKSEINGDESLCDCSEEEIFNCSQEL